MFVLTARPAESAPAIFAFIKAIEALAAVFIDLVKIRYELPNATIAVA